MVEEHAACSATLTMLKEELNYVVSESHKPHPGGFWECPKEPCRNILQPALTPGGPAHKVKDA